jgi:hypothetical protein
VDQRSVGRYEILRRVGEGGMATVYLARQTDLDRDVALKELNVVDGADPRVARRFLREARLAGSLSHPNIVIVHDYFQFGGKPYIAMEYLSRGALRPYVGHMSVPQIGGVIEGMLAALAYAEQRGVVHRDLKPENVMVSAEGGVKIADFGIAKATSAVKEPTLNLTATGTTLGTPNYIAPEQAMAQELGPATDLYSLGVMAWEFFVGYVPFHDTEEPIAIAMRHVNEDIPPVSSLRPDVDPGISEWIDRLLVKDPRGRVQSAVLAWDDLEEVLLDLLGPRWRRDAPLPVRPGPVAAPVAAAAAAAAALASARPATAGPMYTLPPTTRRLPPDAQTGGLSTAPTRVLGGNRVRTTALAVLALIAVIALLTGFLSGGKGAAPAPAPSTPAVGPAADTTSTPATAPTAPATAPAAPATPAQPSATAPAGGATAAPPPAAQGDSGSDEQSDDPSDDAGESGSP